MAEKIGEIYFEVTPDTGQMIDNARRETEGDNLKAKLSVVAGAISAIVGLETISKAMQTCAVAEKDFKGYVLKEPVTREESKIPVYNFQAVIDRSRERDRREILETATQAEFAKLRARDEWEASKQAAASVLAAVAAMPAPVVAESASVGMKPDAGQLAASQPQATTPSPAPVVQAKAKRRTWMDAASPYIVKIMQDGQYTTAKELYRALEAKAGPDSPLDKGTGANRGSLVVREIAQSLSMKTVQNNWKKLLNAAAQK